MTPRLLLCATGSGSGKTTLTCGLLMALKKRGLAPSAFKCGPDYIDPMFHREVVGVPSRNLDLFFLKPELICGLLGEYGGEIAIIEGVMGYYDGIAMTDVASAYHVATVTDTPAVLVVNGKGAARTIAATVKGIATFRSDSHINGVILNQVSPMLYPQLKELIEEETGITVYGYLPPMKACSLESRHLGLVTAAEIGDLQQKLQMLGETVEKTVDLNGLLTLAHSVKPMVAETLPTLTPICENISIAVAKDKAFCFYYEDSLRVLEQLGATLVPFSPLQDQALPEDIHGLYLGGGYPELYAEELSKNSSMLRSIKEAINRGLPTIAECGGFLYLHESLEDDTGKAYPMVGAIPQKGEKTDKLRRFGYVTLTAREGGLLGSSGFSIPAHEFHYWESSHPGDAFTAQKPCSQRSWQAGYHTPTLYAGFPHFHFLSNVSAAKAYLLAAISYQKKEG